MTEEGALHSMALNLYNPFAEADFDRLDPTPTTNQLLAAQHIVIVALSQLGYERILPAFQPLQERDDRSRALAHLSYRLLGLVLLCQIRGFAPGSDGNRE
jgi:hypothetical protein